MRNGWGRQRVAAPSYQQTPVLRRLRNALILNELQIGHFTAKTLKFLKCFPLPKLNVASSILAARSIT